MDSQEKCQRLVVPLGKAGCSSPKPTHPPMCDSNSGIVLTFCYGFTSRLHNEGQEVDLNVARGGCTRVCLPPPHTSVVAQDWLIAEQLQREEFQRATGIGPGWQGGSVRRDSRSRTHSLGRGRGCGVRFQYSHHGLHYLEGHVLPGHHINVPPRNCGLFHWHGEGTGNEFTLNRLGVSSFQLTGVRPEALQLMARQSDFTPEDYETLVRVRWLWLCHFSRCSWYGKEYENWLVWSGGCLRLVSPFGVKMTNGRIGIHLCKN